LIGQHNIHFYHALMREVRQSILEDRFLALYHEKRAFLAEEDTENPVKPPKRSAKSAAPTRVGAFELLGEQIVHVESGQVVSTGPNVDVEALKRLLLEKTDEELVVRDEQLGAGNTALAVILAYEALSEEKGTLRPMRVISRADELDALKLALGHKRLFEHLKHGAADTVVLRGKWISRFKPGLIWELEVA
jgi:queuine tRNA-ribosyltransferase